MAALVGARASGHLVCGLQRATLRFAGDCGADASLWVDPERIEQRASSPTFLTSDRDGLKWTLALKDGARQWMIAALDKTASLAPFAKQNLYQAPLPQQYQIKYNDFPLDRIKNYITRWPGDETDHPRLIVRKNDIAAFCRNFRPDPPNWQAIARLRSSLIEWMSQSSITCARMTLNLAGIWPALQSPGCKMRSTCWCGRTRR